MGGLSWIVGAVEALLRMDLGLFGPRSAASHDNLAEISTLLGCLFGTTANVYTYNHKIKSMISTDQIFNQKYPIHQFKDSNLQDQTQFYSKISSSFNGP